MLVVTTPFTSFFTVRVFPFLSTVQTSPWALGPEPLESLPQATRPKLAAQIAEASTIVFFLFTIRFDIKKRPPSGFYFVQIYILEAL
jgi:hypothetical protein